MFAPLPSKDVFESEFKYNMMTTIYWDFRKELWFDPSAKQEVINKLWLKDSDIFHEWKNVPPGQGITTFHRSQTTSELSSHRLWSRNSWAMNPEGCQPPRKLY